MLERLLKIVVVESPGKTTGSKDHVSAERDSQTVVASVFDQVGQVAIFYIPVQRKLKTTLQLANSWFTNMVESKEKDSADKILHNDEGKESDRGLCLYVSLRKGEDSPAVIFKKLESFGFKVNKESNIATAEKLCSSTRMALIVLEDCEEKKFIEAIKSPKACNEHTPIVFISSGPLSDIVRHLMQEQYIDELVFKCLTLECDLGSAVNRLITQPGQFAVTPKSKRPGIVKKRKLETGRNKEPPDAVSPTDWQSAPSTGGLPLIPPSFHGCDYSQSTYHMNHFMMPMPPVQQQGCDLPAEQMPYGGGISFSHNAQLQPCCELNFHSVPDSGKHNVQVKKENSVEQCMNGSTISGCAQIIVDDHCSRPSVIVKADKEESVNSEKRDKDNTEESKIREDSKEKKIQSAERKKVSKTSCSPAKDIGVQTASPSSAKKSRTSGQSRTKRKSTGSTSIERKVQHLDKEKKRRERITKSWHCLRQLVPNCDTYADKATVFEMSVAYLHHCWKYHGPLLQQINKEFASLNKTNIPPEDMEDNVTEVIEKESKRNIRCFKEGLTAN